MRLPLRATLVVVAAASALTGCLGEGDARVQTDHLPNDRQDASTQVCIQAPANAPARLLTREEYNNTVRDLLGDATRPADAFPVEARVLGFENNASANKANSL